MTQQPPGSGEESWSVATLAALQTLGFTQRDSMRLRFWFKAARLRQAVELASDLRTIGGNVVQVRPGQPWLRVLGRWNVILSTPRTPLAPAPIRRLESDLRSIARRHTGCCFVGWEPLLEARDVPYRLSRASARGGGHGSTRGSSE
jgi:hypothetical protein